eukprot:s101_g5.t2
MFEDLAHDWSVRAVKMTESKKLVKVASMADGSDEEEYEGDELHKWYEDLEVDKLNSKKAKSGENILRWDETKQDWMVKPFEIPSPGFTDSEEEIDLSKQDWTDGRVIKVRGSAVFGDVTQPLFAVGKLWKVGWGLDPLDQFNAFLKKGGARVPVRFVRNSTVTDLKIYRAQVKVVKEEEPQVFLKKGGARVPVRFVRNSTVTDLKIYRAQVKVVKEEEPQVRKLTLIKQMGEDFEKMKYHEGWFFMSDGKPARFDWDKNTTSDPTRDEVKTFKYRTTLVTRYEGEEIISNELEFFECAEEWKGSEEVHIDLAKEHCQ